MHIVTDFLSRQSKSFLITMGVILIGLVASIDYLVEGYLSVFAFYLVPIVIVTWFVGKRDGLLISVVGAFAWAIADTLANPIHLEMLIHYWNLLEVLSVFVIVTIILSALRTTQEEKQRRELEIAQEVQADLLPKSLPSLSTLDYTAICKPAQGVSGDYYDFLLFERHTLGIAVGDVSGKGISAALLMANLQGLLRSYAPQRYANLVELMSDINRSIFMSTDQSRFVTLFYGLYNDMTRILTYVNAGQNPPILLRLQSGRHVHITNPIDRPIAEGHTGQQSGESFRIIRLETGGVPVGAFPDVVYNSETLQLNLGDILVIFTDGIPEAKNSLDQEYGEERIGALVAENPKLSPVELCDLILRDLNQFVGSELLFDDITLVIAKVV